MATSVCRDRTKDIERLQEIAAPIYAVLLNEALVFFRASEGRELTGWEGKEIMIQVAEASITAAKILIKMSEEECV